MWTINNSNGGLLALEKMAVARGVALYEGEQVLEESGTVIVTKERLYYHTATTHYSTSITSVKQVVLQKGTLTRSPKLVLFMEEDLIKCEVCMEKTKPVYKCEQCGSAILWQCRVCDHDNHSSCRVCVECGCEREEFDEVVDTIANVYKLSFRVESYEPVYTALITVIKKTQKPTVLVPPVGVGGLLERRQHEFLEREHAIASLAHNITDEALEIVISMVRDGNDNEITLKWANQGELMIVLDVFLNERVLVGNHAMTLADLYCTVNRQCAIGYFVPLELLTKCLHALEKQRRLYLIFHQNVNYYLGYRFDINSIVDLVGTHGSTIVDIIDGDSCVDRVVVEAVLYNAVDNGQLVIDEPASRFFKNPFLL